MTRVVLVLALLGAALVGLPQCAGRDQRIELTSRPNCPAVQSSTYFFPAGAFYSERPDVDGFVRTWYTQHLTRMEEPSLSCGATTSDVSYRFLWLRTWGRPIAVRVMKSGSTIHLAAVELSGAGGYEPGTVARRQSLTLATGDWERIDDALAIAQFWNGPTTIEQSGFDGAQWIIEGRRQNQYHVVDRWSPESDDGVHKLGLLFLELAGWSDSIEPVY